MNSKTPLHQTHLDAGAKMVDFAGWDMPIHYGSQVQEHHHVRTHCGLFDVSHMTIVDIEGKDSRDWLRKLLANDVAKLDTVDGRALYTAMLNEKGGVLDDLIVYRVGPGYRLVVNSATREKDLDWMRNHINSDEVRLLERPELAMIAIQGPAAVAICQEAFANRISESGTDMSALKPFHSLFMKDWMWCRTGYTGEDGFELILPGGEAAAAWSALVQHGARPCGLGARDTLRLEAGMNLYGSDMDDQVTPWSCGMGWTVSLQPGRDFIGRAALEAAKATHPDIQVGLVLRQRGVLRSHQPVLCGKGQGEITSGSFSPSLGISVALARVPAETGSSAEVEIRGKLYPVEVVQPPFVRNGKPCVSGFATILS